MPQIQSQALAALRTEESGADFVHQAGGKSTQAIQRP